MSQCFTRSSLRYW